LNETALRKLAIVALVSTTLGCVRFGFDPNSEQDLAIQDDRGLSDTSGGSDGQTLDGVSPEGAVADGPVAKPDGPVVKPDGPVVKPDVLVLKPDVYKPDVLKPDALKPPDTGVPAPGVWITVNAGSFSMGSPTSEPCRDNDETLHTVVLTHGYLISKTETTQGQFQALMSYNPANNTSCGSSCPVENLSWYEAAAYCNQLSALTKRGQCYTCSGSLSNVTCTVGAGYQGAQIYSCPGYRLPTEAEWEHAARAGTTTAVPGGTITQCKHSDSVADVIAWYKQNSGTVTHPVSGKQLNGWNLADMAGNVREWTGDWYVTDLGAVQVTNPTGPASGQGRVTKGGHYFDFPENVRSAHREESFPHMAFDNLGFRCVRSLP
jgi:formylglycine-generating enzyme required for sulfatase activity